MGIETNQYYTDRYSKREERVVVETKNDGSEQSYEDSMEAGVDTGVYGDGVSGSGYEDSFGFEGISGPQDSAGEIEDLTAHLQDIEQTVQSDSRLGDLNADISKAKSKLNQAAHSNLSEQRRERLLSDVDALMSELDAKVEAEQPIHDLSTQLDQLKKDVEATDFPKWHASDKADLLKKISQAQTQLDLNTGEQNLEAIGESVGEIQSNFDEIKGNLKSEQEESTSNLAEQKDSLIGKIEDSKLKATDIENFKSQVEAQFETAKAGLENGSLSPQDAEKAFQDIDSAVGKMKREKDLAAILTGLPAKVVNSGDMASDTADLAIAFKQALHDNNWSAVTKFLDKFPNKVPNPDAEIQTAWQGAPVMMRFMGALSDLVAGDEDKMNQLLDLIPAEIRQKMIQVGSIGANSYNSISADNKTTNGYYGTAKITIDRLQDSLNWSDDHADDEYLLSNQESWNQASAPSAPSSAAA